MGNLNRIPEVVVVHKRPRKNGKIFLEVFENVRVDDIINAKKLKPLIPCLLYTSPSPRDRG